MWHTTHYKMVIPWFVCVINDWLLHTLPLPLIQCWFRNSQRLAQYFSQHYVHWYVGGEGRRGGRGGEGPIDFVCECISNDFHAGIFLKSFVQDCSYDKYLSRIDVFQETVFRFWFLKEVLPVAHLLEISDWNVWNAYLSSNFVRPGRTGTEVIHIYSHRLQHSVWNVALWIDVVTTMFNI